MTFIQYLLYVTGMDGYATLVGNSLVRNWDRKGKGPIRIKCLPGATLDTIIDSAKDFRCVNQIVFLQSGIPDLYVRGVAEIDEDKLEAYKQALVRVNVVLQPPVLILPIYPPSGSSEYICNVYSDFNYYIRSLNSLETPNTVSRIFHRLHKSGWRIDHRRLQDSVHPTETEGRRIYRRLTEYLQTGSDFARVGNTGCHPWLGKSGQKVQ